MAKTLETAEAAAKERNWPLVIQFLKNYQPETSQVEKFLNLVLQVFLEGDFQQRWDIVSSFPKLGKEAIAPLLSILTDEQAELETRWFAGRILGEFDEPEVVISLTEMIQQSEDEDLSAVATDALANIGESAISALTELLSHPQSRLSAVRSLAQIRRSETVEPLLSVVSDSQAEVRAIAIEALGSFHDRRVLPILLRCLKDPAAAVRKEAVIALGMRSASQAEFDLGGQIQHLLYDLNPEVCQQAVIALGRIGSKGAANEILFQLLKSPTTPCWLKQETVRALSWTANTSTLSYLQEGLLWSDASVCREIITALGSYREPNLRNQATQILIDFLLSGQENARQVQIKQTVAMSLGHLGDPRALLPLEELSADTDLGVQLHAIAALKIISKT